MSNAIFISACRSKKQLEGRWKWRNEHRNAALAGRDVHKQREQSHLNSGHPQEEFFEKDFNSIFFLKHIVGIGCDIVFSSFCPIALFSRSDPICQAPRALAETPGVSVEDSNT